MEMYFVNLVLPKKGMKITLAEYRNCIVNMCKENPYPFQQAIGSLGGASRAGTIDIIDGLVIRTA